MEIKELHKRQNINQDKGLTNRYVFFEKLISELKRKEMSTEILNSINQEIEAINSFSGVNKDLLKQLWKSESVILKLIKKELKLVPKNHYFIMGMILGITIGLLTIPLAALCWSIGIMQPIAMLWGMIGGMLIGNLIGITMDAKVAKSGNQLDLDCNSVY